MMANPKQVLTDFTLARTSLIMGAYALTKNMRQRQPLLLARESNSKVDPNDVMVVLPGRPNRKIGYLPPGLAAKIAPLMDRGVKVIAQKAPNVLYGICQLAYIPPDEPESTSVEIVGDALTEAPLPMTQEEINTIPEYGATGASLPEGVTQEDIDTATDLPPLGDSRRPHQKEPTDDEPTPDDDGGPQEGL